MAQIPPPQPRVETNPGAVVDNPYRVFGDDAPVFAPLALLGAIGFSVSAGLVTEYSDNVARQPDGGSLPSRFASKDDWIFRPNVSLQADYPLGRQRVFGSASVGRTIYARNSNLNANSYNFSGGAQLSIGNRCGANVRTALSKRDTQLGTFEDVVPSTQTRTNLGGSVNCRTASGLSGSVGYSRGKSTNRTLENGTDRSFANVTFQSVSGSLGYAVGARGQVGLSGGWSENSYPNQLLLTGEVNRNEIRNIAIFGAYRIGNTLRANASFGTTEVTSNAVGATGFKGSSWSFGMSYAGPRLGGSLATGRSVNGAAGGSSNYSISDFVALSTTYRLRDSMSLSAGYSHNNSDQRGITQVPGTVAVQSSVNDRVFAGLDYRLNRQISIGADLNHLRRSSSPSNFSYKVNTATISARANF